MPQFAAFVTQAHDYAGPRGFLSVEAEDATAAAARVFAMAEDMENTRIGGEVPDSCCVVHFALPVEMACLAAGTTGEDLEIRPAGEVIDAFLEAHRARNDRPGLGR